VRGVEFIALNTDNQALIASKATTKVQLGDKLTNGLGANGDTEIGKMAAKESMDDIARALKGADMVFIAAGMGGGTGTGAAPIIAAIARELGALAVAVITKPFTFERAERLKIAEKGIARLKDAVDALLVIHNDRLIMADDEKISLAGAFKRADDALCQTIQCVSDLINKPDFKALQRGNLRVTSYSPQELKDVSVGANALLGGLGGAAVGTAGGFAAAGATTAAVMALGTASTGTAIVSLSGAAATNAVLAALGGGSLAAGGGGVALGTLILGASTLGIGLLIAGVIFSISGSAVSNKSDKSYVQMLEAECTIDDICIYLKELKATAIKYLRSLKKVQVRYAEWLQKLQKTVNVKTDWNSFSHEEKLNAENLVLAVGLLYEMCNVKLVDPSLNEKEMNKINHDSINSVMFKSDTVLQMLSP
jgi:hypothetical protein